MTETYNKVKINQSVAVLIDGNNIEISLQSLVGDKNVLLDFDAFIPKILNDRGLNRLIYFREGKSISPKLAERLLDKFHGSVMPCHKSADIPLTIKATQIANKVDTIIILSGDADYVELVRHLRGEGVRVEIAAVEQTTARILKEEADHFTAITETDSYSLKPKTNPKSSNPKNKPKSNKDSVKPRSKPSQGNRKRSGGRTNQNKGKTSS